MNISGTHDEIMAAIIAGCPGADAAIARAYTYTKRGKQEVYPYQAAAIYALARQYDRDGAQILELGTYYGFTAAVMAEAAPRANIVTLNPVEWEVADACKGLARYENVSVVMRHSWDYLKMLAPDWAYDLIFVDGDHKRVRLDLPYWNRLRDGGLFLFHDYTPLGSPRHCPPVFEVVNGFGEFLGRQPDVLIVDNLKVGMAGFYRKAGDPAWSSEDGK